MKNAWQNGEDRGRRRRLLASTALSAALLAAPGVRAQTPAIAANTTPQGGLVVGGAAGIARAPGSVTITQSSARAAIDWQSFDVGAGARVIFKQPSAQAIALNRVVSSDPSIIAGRIDANGRIVLMNQNGVVFTPGSQVNAESLVVSTAGISAKNFMAGRMVFDRAPKPGARIVNDGTITMKQAGLAAFVAPQVVNRGVITATLGHVILAGVSTFTLDVSGDGLVSIDVTHAVRKVDLGGRVVDALVTNTGMIVADGGAVTLTAQAVDGVIQQLLDVRGAVRADSVGRSSGSITIAGIGGDLQVAGSLLARGVQPGSRGGTIAVDASGAVMIDRTARIDASGAAGGGVVALGTDAARAVAGPADRVAARAASVSIAQGALIAADATRSGAGGTVTLLSHQRTTQGGAISAQGAGDGAGGTIETSSDGVISLTGTETVFSPHGAAGTILLDPATLFVGIAVDAATAGSVVSGGVTTIGTDPNLVSFLNPAVLDRLTGRVIVTASSLLAVQSPIAMADTSPVTLASGGAVEIAAAVSTGGSLEIDAATSIVLGALVTAPTLNLQASGVVAPPLPASALASPPAVTALASGTIVEATGGAVNVTNLEGTAAGSALLAQPGNQVATLAGFVTGGSFSLDDAGHPLDITGLVSAANATLAADGITIAAPISVVVNLQGPGPLALASTGGITQTAGSGIVASGLTSLGTVTGGDVALTGTNNQIGTLGAFTATGALALDNATPLAVTGPIGAASIALTDPAAITLAGPLAVGSGGAIDLTGGGIADQGGSFVSPDGTISLSAFALAAALDFGAGRAGAAEVAPGLAGAIAASGARDVVLHGDGIMLDTPITVAGTLDLQSAGPIGQTAPITAPVLTGVADGTVALGSANAIGTLGSFIDAREPFALSDAATLVVGGPVLADTIALAAGALAIPGSIAANAVSLGSAGAIGETGGIDAATLSGSAAGGIGLTGSNAIGALGTLTSAGAINLIDGTGVTIDGLLSAAAATIAATAIAIPGSIDTGALLLNTPGGISETGGISTATLASGGAIGGAVALTGANTIAALGDFAVANAGFALTDAVPLSIAGSLSAAGIALNAPSIAISGVIATPGTLSLGFGALSETGAIDAGVLQAVLGGTADLGGANRIATLGSVNDAGYDVTLNDAGPLALIGPVIARAVSISATGQLVLDGSAGGGLFIQGSGLALPVSQQVQPRPGIDSVLQVTNGGAQQLVQTGNFYIDTGPIASAAGVSAQSNTVFVILPSSGSARFAGLDAPNTTLVLDLGNGTASGQLVLHFLVVASAAGGQASFTGSLDNRSGGAAAQNGEVVPLPGSNYQFNACIIGAVSCSVPVVPVVPVVPLPVVPQADPLQAFQVLAEGNPLQAFDIGPRRRRRLDRDVRLPGIAAKDY